MYAGGAGNNAMILKIFSPKNAGFTQNTASLQMYNFDNDIFIKKNANLFRQKLAKIAENGEHNIEPW
jgi:endo-1,4-beta-mannosidase